VRREDKSHAPHCALACQPRHPRRRRRCRTPHALAAAQAHARETGGVSASTPTSGRGGSPSTTKSPRLSALCASICRGARLSRRERVGSTTSRRTVRRCGGVAGGKLMSLHPPPTCPQFLCRPCRAVVGCPWRPGHVHPRLLHAMLREREPLVSRGSVRVLAILTPSSPRTQYDD
jgi:hypothetical protein